MSLHRFHIDSDTIDGLAQIHERFGKSMSEYILHQWLIDHQIIPSERFNFEDKYIRNDAGILIQARVFTQRGGFAGC